MATKFISTAAIIGLVLVVSVWLLPAGAVKQTTSTGTSTAVSGTDNSDSTASDSTATGATVSGTVVNGLRILTLPKGVRNVRLFVYRGDYIKFRFDEAPAAGRLSIPDLAIDQQLPGDFNQAPYFKMKRAGTYAFSLGEVQGHLTVIPYLGAHYQELTSHGAAEFIRDQNPLILDVRTKPEYQQGHLRNSRLIPVQELRRRMDELADWKDRDILIYCATGNRSTVASKILIDNGFNRIFNMRYGIYDWHRQKLPIVR